MIKAKPAQLKGTSKNDKPLNVADLANKEGIKNFLEGATAEVAEGVSRAAVPEEANNPAPTEAPVKSVKQKTAAPEERDTRKVPKNITLPIYLIEAVKREAFERSMVGNRVTEGQVIEEAIIKLLKIK